MGLVDHIKAAEDRLGGITPDMLKEEAEGRMNRAILHLQAAEMLIRLQQAKEVGKEFKAK